MRGHDLLSIAELTADEVTTILNTALSLKRDGGGGALLAGKTLALIFEKPSLRTRVSFEVGMQQLGGKAIYLNQAEVGLGQREPVADVARVLSRYVHVIAARTYEHQTLIELAKHADVPVINALSDEEHPCQALADLLTVLERFGTLRGVRLAFVGDGFNVAASLAEAAALTGVSFAIASPEGYSLPEGSLRLIREHAEREGGRIDTYTSPEDAVRGADVVYTDVWASMGQEDSYRAAQGSIHRLYRDVEDDGAREARRHLHARPAGASRRRSDQRGDRERAVSRLRSGGEQASRAEGDPRPRRK